MLMPMFRSRHVEFGVETDSRVWDIGCCNAFFVSEVTSCFFRIIVFVEGTKMLYLTILQEDSYECKSKLHLLLL